MNKFIKGIIEETFKSKKQQRLFYAKANDTSLPKKDRKKWGKWAKEFSDKTDFENIPNEVDEIVDAAGNISRIKKPLNLNTKGITSHSTSDEVVKTGAGTMGTHGVHGTHTSLRYWAESDMSKALGYKDTLGQDDDYDDAEHHFEDDLGLNPDETKDRMAQMGYDEKLPEDKVRLIENPRKFMEEYIESILRDKSKSNDLVQREEDETEEKEINPIVLKQIKSLKNSMDSNKLTVNDIIKHLKNNE